MVIALALGGIAIALAARSTPGNVNSQKLSPLQLQKLAIDRAAAWIDDQVNPTTMIACDRATCDALNAGGYAEDKLQVLGQHAQYPLSAGLVVETGSVRKLFGTSLSSDWAPAVLTRFGTGAAEIEIRVIAPDGASAYWRALARDVAARKKAAGLVLYGSRIATSAKARAQAFSGAVDWRLLFAISEIAGKYPVYIVDFGSKSVGATRGIPLRYADLSGQFRAARMPATTYIAAMAAAIQQLKPPYQPLHTVTVPLRSGGVALRVEFAAPSPPDPFGPTGG
jgi:hypothetical protein